MPDQSTNRLAEVCSLPWVELHITPQGKLKSCCAQLGQLETLTDANRDLQKTFNGPAFQGVRQGFLTGNPPASCADCLRLSRLGSGYKAIKSHQWANQAQRAMRQSDPLSIKFLDVRFSHLCNFACRTCDSENSSRWTSLDPIVGRSSKVGFQKNDTKIKVSDIRPLAESLEEIYFAGGEPLIIKEHYELLEELIALNKTNLTLSYNTNLSVKSFMGKDLLNLWSRFDQVLLYPSIDAVGDAGEFIREGMDWGEFESNFRLFRPRIKGVNAVLSAYNVFAIQDLLLWTRDQGVEISISPAFLPIDITVDVLPQEMLLIAANELDLLLKSSSFMQETQAQIITAIDFLRQPRQRSYALNFLDFNKKLDAHFSKKYAQVFPKEFALINRFLE